MNQNLTLTAMQHRDITPEDYEALQTLLQDAEKPTSIPPWAMDLLPCRVSEDASCCPICFEVVASGEHLFRLSCDCAQVHKLCMTKWFDCSKTCPQCRRDVDLEKLLNGESHSFKEDPAMQSSLAIERTDQERVSAIQANANAKLYKRFQGRPSDAKLTCN